MTKNLDFRYTPHYTDPHQDLENCLWIEPWHKEMASFAPLDPSVSWFEAENLDQVKPLEDIKRPILKDSSI